ncbi:hypothetical protein M2273_002942 [Mucilaginibacter lappiensis]
MGTWGVNTAIICFGIFFLVLSSKPKLPEFHRERQFPSTHNNYDNFVYAMQVTIVVQ